MTREGGKKRKGKLFLIPEEKYDMTLTITLNAYKNNVQLKS